MELSHVLCSFGFLDEMSDEALDEVDDIVFDPEASTFVRVAALRFFLEHTDGFETETMQNQRTKSSLSVQEASEQLETLIEFVQQHILQNTDQDETVEITNMVALLLESVSEIEECGTSTSVQCS